MEHKEQPDIPEFIKMIMPDASIEEQIQAKMNWERFLNAIDEVCERRVRKREAERQRDNSGSCSTVDPPDQKNKKNGS